MKKQTAVEWLQVQLNENGKLSAVDFYQAKEMENQQHKETKVKIIDAYNKVKEKAEELTTMHDDLVDKYNDLIDKLHKEREQWKDMH